MNKLNLLDSKLRKDERQCYTFLLETNWINVKTFTNYILTENELKTILEYVTKSNLMIMIKSDMSYLPIYSIVKGNYLFIGNDIPDIETIIEFREDQLPSNYDFEVLSKHFNSDKNIEMLKYFKQELPRKRESYQY